MSETKNEASSVEIAYQNWLAQVKVNIAKIDKFNCAMSPEISRNNPERSSL